MQNPFADYCLDRDGEGFSRSFYRLHSEGSPTIAPTDLEWQHLLSDYVTKSPNLVTEHSTSPLHGHSNQLAFGQYSKPHGQFAPVQYFQASKMVMSNPFTETEKANSDDRVIDDDALLSKVDGFTPNRIGANGHSVDWTTLTWKQCVNCHSPAAVVRHNSGEEAPLATAVDGINEPLHKYFGSNHGSDLSSEMHENTEELDALLYSDDDATDSPEESEVDSTGRSPCILTVFKKEQIDKSADEILSSAEGSRNRKRKRLDNVHSVATSATDNASSTSIDLCHNEAICRKPTGEVCSVDVFPDTKKRMQQEAIRQAVTVLENIVPGSKGKGSVMFLDEAIQYLESLRAEACSLGFSSSGS